MKGRRAMLRTSVLLTLALACFATAAAQQRFEPKALPPVKDAPTVGGSLVANGIKATAKESLLIGPGDLLHVTILREPELEQRARVLDSGDVSLPLIGSVHVAGLDPAAASSAIA